VGRTGAGKTSWWYGILGTSVLAAAQCVSVTHESAGEPSTPPKPAQTPDEPAAAPQLAAPPTVGPATDAPAPEPGHADLDPTNDWVVAPPPPVADCEQRLSAAGVHFAPAELPLRSGNKGAITCGAEQVVEYRGSASGIRYNSAPLVTCTLALALARFERVLQDEAELHFKSRIRRLEQAGTYNCRKMARFRSMVSEHSYANAIDFRGVTLENGRTIDVLHDFGKLDVEPTSEPSLFLRSVAHRAFDEQVFSVVLTPYFDALHRDHFHLDMARYRVDGTRDTPTARD
jgi:hypothetical protein